MEKLAFYKDKTLTKLEWWISYYSEYPNLELARLRIFSDGMADCAFEESILYSFDNREYASFFLAEDEYMPVSS